MTTDEFVALRRAEPFRPFRAHPSGATWPIAERIVQVPSKDIVRIEFLDIPELV